MATKQNSTSILGDINPPKAIIKLALPATLALLAKAVYNIVDTAYIGMLDSDIALTAVGVTVPLLLIMVSIENIFAAGAAVLELGDNVLASQLSSNGNVDALNIPHVYGNSPFSHDDAQPSYLHMDGHEVYKFAVNAMATGLAETIQAAGLEQSQIDHVLPHQANMRIIQSAMKKLSIPHDRYRININRYGNTSSACIPVLLDELNQAGKLERGQILALTAFGGGLTNGAMVLRW